VTSNTCFRRRDSAPIVIRRGQRALRSRDMRGVRVAVVSVLILVGLTACTVPVRGIIGFTRADDGEISVVVKLCDGSIDGLSIYSANADKLRWTFDPAIDDSGSMTLDGIDELDPDLTYDSYGWSTNNNTSASGPRLTVALLESIEPGQVLSVGAAPRYSSVVTPDEFDRQAAEYCE
jgi:hypothetical protein